MFIPGVQRGSDVSLIMLLFTRASDCDKFYFELIEVLRDVLIDLHTRSHPPIIVCDEN